jgi:hypothetical protein
MTFDKAHKIVHDIAHSSEGAWVATADNERRATATMLLALETRVRNLEAKNQGPDVLRPLAD